MAVFTSNLLLSRTHFHFHAAIVVSNDIPSFGTPEWEAFIETDNSNFQVWLEVRGLYGSFCVSVNATSHPQQPPFPPHLPCF